MDILDKINTILGEEVSKYKSRRVKHGKKRSQAGKLKGAEKRKYLKRLKDKKKKYGRSGTAKRKAAVSAKKYKRTAGAKRAKRMYKGKR
ncbi:MAG: hypothetical protein KAS32_03470 [Candidatus Peribacteraceae bacterium]|nr:hypothetical protein [Candidatus Peribacteraceae bacterium]